MGYLCLQFAKTPSGHYIFPVTQHSQYQENVQRDTKLPFRGEVSVPIAAKKGGGL